MRTRRVTILTLLGVGAFMLAPAPSLAQTFWPVTAFADDAGQVSDTSLANLRSIISTPLPPSGTLRRHVAAQRLSAALRLIAAHYGDAQRAFVLNALDAREAEADSLGQEPLVYWVQLVRGRYGDARAITYMDSLATMGHPFAGVSAAVNLAHAGYYQHYGLVRAEVDAKGVQAYPALAAFADSPQHGMEVRDFFLTQINASPPRLSTEADAAARYLCGIDPPAATAALEAGFAAATGWERLERFWVLEGCDPDGQPERAVWAMRAEPGSLPLYIPQYDLVASGHLSERYLEPWFVRFIVEESGGPGVPTDSSYAGVLLKDFRPLEPRVATSPLMITDSLGMLVDTMAAYGWISPVAFTDSLRAHVVAAQAALTVNDVPTASAALTQFQSDMQEAYEQPVPGVREAARVGHRYLWWTAQYVLDRLE